MARSNPQEPADPGPTSNRRVSYAIGEPDSAPELIQFINCETIEEIQAMSPNDLREAATQGQATIAEWESTIYNHLQTIENLQAKLQAQKIVIEYLEQRPVSHTQDRLKEIDVSVPQLSDGKDPTFENWKAQIEGKFDVNKRLFPSERTKMVYLFGTTAGDAQAHLAARYQSQENSFTTAREMIDHLATVYDDPHKVLNARTDFKRLLMRPSATFHDFYTQFLHLAGVGKIPAEDHRTELYDKLTVDLQKAVLPTYGSLTTCKKLADQCLLLDRELKRIRERTDRIQNRQATTSQTQNPAVGAAQPSSTPSTTPRSTTRPQAQTLGDRPRPTYDSADRQALSRAGACFKCRQPGHRAVECPQNTVKAIEGTSEGQAENVGP
jgi:hypothetical protein